MVETNPKILKQKLLEIGFDEVSIYKDEVNSYTYSVGGYSTVVTVEAEMKNGKPFPDKLDSIEKIIKNEFTPPKELEKGEKSWADIERSKTVKGNNYVIFEIDKKL